MKLLAMLLLLAACDDEIKVINSDGRKQLAYCNGDGWVKCIHDACPNGFEVIDPPHAGGPGLVRCK